VVGRLAEGAGLRVAYLAEEKTILWGQPLVRMKTSAVLPMVTAFWIAGSVRLDCSVGSEWHSFTHSSGFIY